jgi:hypothetical protein
VSDSWHGIGGEYAFDEGYRRGSVGTASLRAELCALRAELERVKGERDAAQTRTRFLEEMGAECVNDWQKIEGYVAQVAALTATNARLREGIADIRQSIWTDKHGIERVDMGCITETLAALADPDGGADNAT